MPIVANDYEIANLALDHLYVTQKITALNESTEPARAANRWYNIVRQALLKWHPWKWAEKRAVLVIDTTAANQHPHWDYAYTLPSDLLAPREIIIEDYRNTPPDWRIPFDILPIAAGTTLKLYTDYPPQTSIEPLLAYTPDLTVVTVFPEHFVTLFSLALAVKMALPLRINVEIFKAVYQAYALAMSDAIASDKGQSQKDADPEAPWILARR